VTPIHPKRLLESFSRSSTWLVVGAGLCAAASVCRAEDDGARAALNQAFARQKALPGYVEHLFGRLPVEPGAAEALADIVTARIKEKATEKAQEKVAAATARSPVAAERAARALARASEQEDTELVISLGPEREFMTVEHSGNRERQVMADGRSEIVRGGGQMAYKYTAPPQARAMLLAATGESAVEIGKQAKSTVASIKAFSGALARGATGDILGATMAAFDEVTRLLADARSTAELTRATMMLERLSGRWQCQPDSGPQYPATMLVAEPLADEALGDEPAHVYFASWRFGTAVQGYPMESRVWIRMADGLPVRSEFSSPGGFNVRTEFEYPAHLTIAEPQCETPPS
jgi:hypothetical protein